MQDPLSVQSVNRERASPPITRTLRNPPPVIYTGEDLIVQALEYVTNTAFIAK